MIGMIKKSGFFKKLKHNCNLLLKLSVNIICVFALFAIILYNFSMKAEGKTDFTPPKQHPRLLVNSTEINRLKKFIETMPRLKEKILQDAENPIIVNNILNGSSINKLKLEETRKNFESNALLYLLDIDPKTGISPNSDPDKTGRKAVNLTLKTLQVMNKVDSYKEYTDSQACGRTLFGAAMVYDWCYNLLSDDEKNTFIKCFETLPKKMELDYPPKSWGAINGHSSEEPLLVHLLGVGIAIYDEKPDMYNLVSNWIFNEVVPARNFWHPSAMQHQGDSYGLEHLECTMLSTWIFARMGYKDIFSKDQSLLPYRYIYTRRPDGQLIRDGDGFKCDQYGPGQYWRFPMPLLLTASYYKDPYTQNELSRQYYAGITGDSVLELLFYDPDVTEKSVKQLPLTRFFGYPMGSMTARTGWDEGVNFNSSTVVADMKVGVYQFNGHQHLDSGQFQIYYKGALAIDSGIYNGTSQDKEHDINYNKRTVAHNCLLVYDEAEKFYLYGKERENDGGQRWPNYGNLPETLDDLLNKDYKTGSVLSHYIGPDNSEPDFSYLKGDLKDAYSSKVEKYERSFVFMNLKNSEHPAALAVYDRVTSSDAKYKKSWLLHSIEAPVVDKNITTIIRSASVDSINKYNGKLVNFTLTPDIDDLTISKVGGKGKEFYSAGKNYPNTPYYENNSVEAGAWRVEISPKTNKKFDRFLNVMQVQDYTDKNGAVTTPLSIKKIDDEYVEGAVLYDRVVLFNKSFGMLRSDFSFSTATAEVKNNLLKYFITDLSEGVWTIKETRKNQFTKTVNVTDDGVLLFEGPPGNYTLYYNLKSGTTAASSTAKASSTPNAKSAGESSIAVTGKPTASPTAKATAIPTAKPTPTPTTKATAIPTTKPTPTPTIKATAIPTTKPTPTPTIKATAIPTTKPTPTPTTKATAIPATKPTPTPTIKATAIPTTKPTPTPTAKATAIPATKSASTPTAKATAIPTPTPTAKVTPIPTAIPATPTPTIKAAAFPAATNSSAFTPVPTLTSTPKALASPENIANDKTEPFYSNTSNDTSAPSATFTTAPTPTVTAIPTTTPTPTITAVPVIIDSLVNNPSDVLAAKVYFDDVPENYWGYKPISVLAQKGIVCGIAPGVFRPNDNVTRAEFVTMIIKALNITNLESNVSFPDVRQKDWFYGSVTSAYNEGLIYGRPDGSFAPNDNIIRQDACIIICRILSRYYGVVPVASDEVDKFTNYKDSGEISGYAATQVATVIKHDMMKGKPGNILDPKGKITRSECAAVIYRLIENFMKNQTDA